MVLLCNPRGFIESWRCYIHSKGIWFIGLKERCKISGALTQKKIRKGKRSNENRCFISANYTSRYLYSTGFVRIAVRLAGLFLPSTISHRAESQADIPIEYGCISFFYLHCEHFSELKNLSIISHYTFNSYPPVIHRISGGCPLGFGPGFRLMTIINNSLCTQYINQGNYGAQFRLDTLDVVKRSIERYVLGFHYLGMNVIKHL